MQLELVRNFRFGNLLVEPFILILSYITLVSVPNSLQVVHKSTVKFNRVADKLRVLGKDLFYFNFFAELSSISSQF